MSDRDDAAYGEITQTLRNVEERLRDLAYEALRAAADGDAAAAGEEKRVLKARRAVERAIVALEPGRAAFDD